MDLLKKIGWLNLFLVFVPITLVLHWTGGSGTWVFATAAVAVIPLAGLMGRSTEMIAERLGPGIGGLMNASFGNAAELIIALFALKAGLVGVVHASITGSIFGNALLVLGLSCFAGGVRFQRQRFNPTAAGMAATLLALSAIALLIPAVFHTLLAAQGQEAVAIERNLSLEICVVLFAVYASSLLFSLKTHKHLYNPEESSDDSADVVPQPADVHPAAEHWPQWVAVTVLIAATIGVALVSEAMVAAIEEAREAFGWTELFVGVIVIAVVGNAAEHSTAILVAWKNQMDLSFQIAVGSAIQIALFVAPVLVFVSYLPGFPTRLDLVFHPLEVAAVLVSVLVVGLVAYDGQSNWFEGLLLLAVYGLLALAFYNLPEVHHSEVPPRQESVDSSSPWGQEIGVGRLAGQYDLRPVERQKRLPGMVPSFHSAIVETSAVASQPRGVHGPHKDEQCTRPHNRFRHSPSLLVT